MGVTSTLSYQSLHREFQVFIGFLIIPRQCSWVPSSSYKSSVTPSRVARSPNHSVWVQRLLQGFFNHLSHARGPLRSRYIKTSLVGLPYLLLGTHDIINRTSSTSSAAWWASMTSSPCWHQWQFHQQFPTNSYQIPIGVGYASIW